MRAWAWVGPLPPSEAVTFARDVCAYLLAYLLRFLLSRPDEYFRKILSPASFKRRRRRLGVAKNTP